MGFGEKIRRALQKMKTKLIIYLIIILIGILFIVLPISLAVTDANIASSAGNDWFETFFMKSGYLIPSMQNFTKVFEQPYCSNFFVGVKYFSLFALIFVFIGVIRALPKHEFDSIENGSSDWAQGGEQYRVLSKKKGIILAEHNYLPVDKRGNVNVLVVRRFWCW